MFNKLCRCFLQQQSLTIKSASSVVHCCGTRGQLAYQLQELLSLPSVLPWEHSSVTSNCIQLCMVIVSLPVTNRERLSKTAQGKKADVAHSQLSLLSERSQGSRNLKSQSAADLTHTKLVFSLPSPLYTDSPGSPIQGMGVPTIKMCLPTVIKPIKTILTYILRG